jgi:hypothetical protein
MLTKDDKSIMKAREEEFRQMQQKHHEELKQFNAERKAAAKEARQNRKLNHKVKEKPAKKAAISRTLLDVFPIRDYQNDYFITDDNQIIDIFQIRGKSYYNASDDDIDSIVDTLAVFFRMYRADFKIIGMNYPTNTKKRQAFLTYMLQRPELQRYENIINSKLARLQELEQSTTDREAFIMVFANNENHYDTLCSMLNRSGLHI